MITKAALLVFLLFSPYFLTKLTLRLRTENWLSPVVLCYIFGIALRNLTAFPVDNGLAKTVSEGAILLAIPLLLYSTDLLGWLKLAKTTILAFILMIISVLTAAPLMGFLFKNHLDDTGLLAGMLTGVFIGGTPNMNAIGIALDASDATFITLNAAEIACGGAYLLFLTSVAHRFFGLFLPDFKGDKHDEGHDFLPSGKFAWRNVLLALGLTVLIAGVSAGSIFLFTGGLQKVGLLLLLISALSVGASLFPKVRNLNGSYEAGEYCLLIFSIAIGLLADFREIFANGGWYIAFCAATLTACVVFHLLLCRLFKIDRDTMMITNTAGIYGPPFIGQVAAVIKNRSLVFSGIATGLVGIAVANFLGVLVGKALRMWLG